MCQSVWMDFWTPTARSVAEQEDKAMAGTLTPHEHGIAQISRLKMFWCNREYIKEQRCKYTSGIPERIGHIRPFCRSDKACQIRNQNAFNQFHEAYAEFQQATFARRRDFPQAERDRAQALLVEWRRVYDHHVDCPQKREQDPLWNMLLAIVVPWQGHGYEGDNPDQVYTFVQRMVDNPYNWPDM